MGSSPNDEFMIFEAMDRSYIVLEHLSMALQDHPAILGDVRAREIYDSCEEKLSDLYQYLGAKMSKTQNE